MHIPVIFTIYLMLGLFHYGHLVVYFASFLVYCKFFWVEFSVRWTFLLLFSISWLDNFLLVATLVKFCIWVTFFNILLPPVLLIANFWFLCYLFLFFFHFPWQYTPVASGWIGCQFVFTYSSQFGLIIAFILHFFLIFLIFWQFFNNFDPHF